MKTRTVLQVSLMAIIFLQFKNTIHAQATNKIDTIGNIGIGTTSPATELHFKGANSSSTNGITLGRGTDDAAQLGRIYTTGGGGGFVFESRDVSRALSSGVDMFFRNAGSDGTRTNFTIKGNNGYIGMGPTSPGDKLHLYTGPTPNYGTTGGITISDSYTVLRLWDAGGGSDNGTLDLYKNGTQNIRLIADGDSYFNGGKIGIGTSSPTEKLSVDGNIYASGNISAYGFIKTKKLTITQTAWPDYVFNKKYKLRSLSSLETFIKQNKHLPEVPSANEVEQKGISVGDNQALLLKKIEELTLYMIAINKKNTEQQKEIDALKTKIASLTK